MAAGGDQVNAGLGPAVAIAGAVAACLLVQYEAKSPGAGKPANLRLFGRH